MQLAKKKKKNNSTVKTIISLVIGINTAQIPVKIENPQHNKDEALLVYPPTFSHTAAPAILPVKGPTKDTTEYTEAFANLPSWPKTFWK